MRRYSRDEWSRVFDHVLGERLPGGSDQGLYEESATQRFVIGARKQVDDRVFRYAYAGSALRSAWGAQAYNAFSSDGDRESNTIAAAAAAGASSITCTAIGTVTADMFAGGYACIYWEMSIYKILHNTAAVAGGTFTVILKEPLEQAIDAASVVSLYRNPYDDVRLLEGAGTHPLWASTVGIPLRDIQSGYYFWVQTWGPAVGVGVGDIGAGASERGLFFVASGALTMLSNVNADGTEPSNQHAGYLLPYTGPGPVGVDQPGALIHFFMQVAP